MTAWCKQETQAEVFDSYVRTKHEWPDVMDVDIFKAFKIDWMSVQYNPQGFLQVDMIFFKDESEYHRGGTIDNTFVGGLG